MKLPIYQVDAFASEVFRGNPAAVVPCPEPLPVELMQNMAGVKANILPVTISSTHICAELVDGQIIEQEFNVRALGKPVYTTRTPAGVRSF